MDLRSVPLWVAFIGALAVVLAGPATALANLFLARHAIKNTEKNTEILNAIHKKTEAVYVLSNSKLSEALEQARKANEEVEQLNTLLKEYGEHVAREVAAERAKRKKRAK